MIHSRRPVVCQCQEQLDAEHFICWTRSLTFLGLYGRKTVLLSSGGYRKAHDVYWIAYYAIQPLHVEYWY